MSSRCSLFTWTPRQLDESFDSSSEEDRYGYDMATTREKRPKKVEVFNPLSTFERQTPQRKSCFAPSPFIKEKWLGL